MKCTLEGCGMEFPNTRIGRHSYTRHYNICKTLDPRLRRFSPLQLAHLTERAAFLLPSPDRPVPCTNCPGFYKSNLSMYRHLLYCKTESPEIRAAVEVLAEEVKQGASRYDARGVVRGVAHRRNGLVRKLVKPRATVLAEHIQAVPVVNNNTQPRMIDIHLSLPENDILFALLEYASRHPDKVRLEGIGRTVSRKAE